MTKDLIFENPDHNPDAPGAEGLDGEEFEEMCTTVAERRKLFQEQNVVRGDIDTKRGSRKGRTKTT